VAGGLVASAVNGGFGAGAALLRDFEKRKNFEAVPVR
jgi:hypothetical protein